MQIKTVSTVTAGALLLALAASSATNNNQPVDIAVAKGAKWIASVQGHDGGWGQDGGETSYVRQNERLETNGNDVANTAVAALALRRAGDQYKPNVERALAFIMREVENSPADGLLVTNRNGTQIQRKLGPFIDTFLTSMLLSEVDGTMPNAAQNARVRKALEKCVAKIENNQQRDGSWNAGGGWAPILGTSMASRSLYEAQKKGVDVRAKTMARADDYTKQAASAPAGSPSSADAGVGLYKSAQALEQLSRTEGDRRANAPQIAAIKSQLKDERFVNGFGSVGGEEFFSYLNVSDGLRRTGGPEWNQWRTEITARILKLQNEDGTWSGSHCITGRVAVTSAAILNLTVK
jgi:Squalene-hopene cyclase C-terminal domain/Prenyltransferase and squalene oxidase repeat